MEYLFHKRTMRMKIELHMYGSIVIYCVCELL